MPVDLLESASRPARTALRRANGFVTPLLRRGLGSLLPVGPGVVLLETTGRETGERREVPLLTMRTPRRLLVGTGRRRSDWLANLQDDPEVAVWLNGVRHRAIAHVWRGRVGVVELEVREPEPQPSTGQT